MTPVSPSSTISPKGASSPWIKGSYYRLFYQINVANAYLRETTEDKLDARGCDASLKASIKTWRAEARFLRALSYEYALDLYRNVPFVDENSPIGSIPPKQIMAADLFNWIEKELTECVEDMLEPTVGYSHGTTDMPTKLPRGHSCHACTLMRRLTSARTNIPNVSRMLRK